MAESGLQPIVLTLGKKTPNCFYWIPLWWPVMAKFDSTHTQKSRHEKSKLLNSEPENKLSEEIAFQTVIQPGGGSNIDFELYF